MTLPHPENDHPRTQIHPNPRSTLPPRDTAALGMNPLPDLILNTSPLVAAWSHDKSAEEIVRVVDHWSMTLFGIGYNHLRSPHDRGRVFSKMSERLRAGECVDGPDISIGNIFGSRAAEWNGR